MRNYTLFLQFCKKYYNARANFVLKIKNINKSYIINSGNEEFTLDNVKVLIVGSDANAYYMARCAHEAFDKKPHVISKTP